MQKDTDEIREMADERAGRLPQGVKRPPGERGLTLCQLLYSTIGETRIMNIIRSRAGNLYG